MRELTRLYENCMILEFEIADQPLKTAIVIPYIGELQTANYKIKKRDKEHYELTGNPPERILVTEEPERHSHLLKFVGGRKEWISVVLENRKISGPYSINEDDRKTLLSIFGLESSKNPKLRNLEEVRHLSCIDLSRIALNERFAREGRKKEK